MLPAVRNRGFSLGEIVLALALISLIAVTLLGVIPAAMSATKEAGHRAAASRLAESTVEELGQTSAAVGPQPVSTKNVNGMDFVVKADIQLAVADVAVQTTNNSHSNTASFSNVDPQHARIISVVVSWRENGRQPRSQTIRRQIFARQ